MLRYILFTQFGTGIWLAFLLVCCHGLAPTGNKEPRGHSVMPPSRWDGEENWKKKAKLMCWDKDSLTEQRRKKKITAIINLFQN